MSARLIVLLALVACVSIHANSYPYGTKGGSSYTQQPVKGQYYQQQPLHTQQVLSAPAQPQPMPVKGSFEPHVKAPRAPVMGQTFAQHQRFESAPVKGQSYYGMPQAQKAPLVEQQPQPVLAQEPLASQAPLQLPTSQYQESPIAPVKGQQSFFQLPARPAPFKGQAFYQQEQQPLRVPAKSSQETFTSGTQVQSAVQVEQQQHFEQAPSKPAAVVEQRPAEALPAQASQEPVVNTAQVGASAPVAAPAQVQVQASVGQAEAAAPAVSTTTSQSTAAVAAPAASLKAQ